MAAAAGALAGGPIGAVAGLGEALGSVLGNIGRCGTIGAVGCVKRSDTEIDKEGEIAMRRVLAAVHQGKMPASQGDAAIVQIYAQMQQAWTQKTRSCCTPHFDGFCGSDPKVSPPYNQQIGVGADDIAATFQCGTTTTFQQQVQDFRALLPQLEKAADSSSVGGMLSGIGGGHAGVQAASMADMPALPGNWKTLGMMFGGAVALLILFRMVL